MQTKKGFYEYFAPDFSKPRKPDGLPALKKYRLRVEILNESELTYKVKFIGLHIDGRRPGYVTHVKKKNIEIDNDLK